MTIDAPQSTRPNRFASKPRRKTRSAVAVIAALMLIATATPVFAAVPVSSATITSAPASGSTSGSLTYGTGNDDTLVDFVAGGTTYVFDGILPVLSFERIDNSLVTGQREVIWSHRTDDINVMLSSEPVSMVDALQDARISDGADNVFANTPASEPINNIERIDFGAPTGLPVADPVTEGFALFERGGNDPFTIAAITAVDSAGKPTAYGPVVVVPASAWGPTGYSLKTTVARRDTPSDPWVRASSPGTQDVDGVYVSWGELGVAPGTTIFGFSLFPNDVGSDLVGLSDASLTTNSSGGQGGLDLIGARFAEVEPEVELTDDESLDNPPGTDVTLDIVGNDVNGDPVDPASVMLVDPATGLPVSGPVTVPGEGTWTYDPTTGEITFSPEAGFLGDPTPLEYVASDFAGNVAEPAEVVVTYLPSAIDDESLDNPAGSTVTVDVLGNDPTVDLDPSTVAIDDPNYDPSTGTLVVPGEGTWTVDPATGEITFTPEAGFLSDPTPISYTVEDADGNEVSAEVVVTYLPVLEPDEDLGNIAGTPVTIDVLGNDPTNDLDPTSVEIIDPATGLPASGPVVVPGEGTWTVDPVTGAITFTPEPGFPGDPTPIDYQAADVGGALAEPVEVIVGYLDVEPVPSDENLDNPPGTPVVVDVVANDGNVDPTTVQLVDPATGQPIAGDLVVPGEGTWTVDPVTGELTFTPEPGFLGDPTPVAYTVINENGITVGAEAVVTYLPLAIDDESLDNPAGSTVTVDVLGNDPTVDLDPSTVAIDDPNYDPSTGTLVVPGEGTWTVDPATGAISFVPEAGFLGDPTPISYTVEDADGNEVSAEVVVTYLNPDEVADDESLGNVRGTAVTLDVVDNDGEVVPTTVMIVDPSTGEQVTSLVVPGEGTWTVDPVTGALTFTPESGFEGDPTPVDYVVTSVAGEVLTATARITYVDPAPAPVLAFTGIEGSQLVLVALLLIATGVGLTIISRREDEIAA